MDSPLAATAVASPGLPCIALPGLKPNCCCTARPRFVQEEQQSSGLAGVNDGRLVEGSADTAPDLPEKDYCSVRGGNAGALRKGVLGEQETGSLGIHLNRGVGSYKSEGLLHISIFIYENTTKWLKGN